MPTVPDPAGIIRKIRHGKKWPHTLRFLSSRLVARPTGVAQEEHLLRRLSQPILSSPLAADFGPGPEAAAEGRSAGRGVCCVCLAPPTSGLARRRQRRGALLDGEISFHSHCRLRAWPGGGSGGALSWTRAGCLRLSQPTSGGGSGGALCLGLEFTFLSFTDWPLHARPSYAWSLVPTPSKNLRL